MTTPEGLRIRGLVCEPGVYQCSDESVSLRLINAMNAQVALFLVFPNVKSLVGTKL